MLKFKNMKNTIIKALSAVFFSIALYGCIEEAMPYGGTLTEDQLNSQKDVILSTMINGIPASMTAADLIGTDYQTDFGLPAIHIMTENMLEDFICKGEPYYDQFVYFVACLSMGPTSVEATYYWSAYYKWIKMANEIIGLISPDTEDAQELFYLGQAYAYRAMCYLDLARLCEPKQNKYVKVSDKILGLTVPIVTEKTTQEQALNNARADRETMYKFILDDLDKADKALTAAMSEGLASGYTDPGINAVQGMMARAYLEMGYWKDSKSAEYFQKASECAVNAAGGYTPLTETQWHDPNTGFNSGSTNNSWIWGLTLASSNTNNLLNFTAMVSGEAQFGYGPMIFRGISEDFYMSMTDGDFRKESFIDPEWTILGGENQHDYQFSGTGDDANAFLSGIAYYGAEYASTKFRPALGKTVNSTLGTTADHPLMRTEEMLFIDMEATLYTDGVSAAKNKLEDFMNQYRMVDGKTYSCPESVTDEETFLTEMLLQKRAEFWGEGILIFDYKRLNAPINRIIISGGQIDPTLSRVTTERSPQWNLNIPRSEIQNNNGIPQDLNNPDPSGFDYESLQ